MLRKYLDDRQRQGSVILPATIDSHRPDGDENVRIRHTGQVVRASRGNTGGTYEIGQVVQVSRTDASGVTSNTGWVIIGPPPTSMRGSSSSAPLTETKTHSGTAITLIVPNPVPLVAGGDSVTVTLHGVFAGVTGVSFGTSEIVNDVPPTATDSEITLEVRATVGAVPGDYDLLLDGAVVAPGLFEVSSAVVSVPDHSLWALAYDASFATQYLLRIDPADMSVFRTYPLANAILTYLSVKSGVIYAKVGGEFVRIDIATGDVLAPVSCTPSMDDSLTLGDIGDLLFYGGGDSGSPTLIEFDASLNSESSSALPSGSHSFRAAAVDSGGALLWICGGTHFIKWDIGTSSALITLTPSGGAGDDTFHQNVAESGGDVFISRGQRLERRDAATLTVQAHIDLASDEGVGVNCSMRVIGGFLYAVVANDTPSLCKLARYTPATMAEASAVALGFQSSHFTYADGVFYVADSSGGVTRVDEATMSIIDRTPYVTNDVMCILYT